MNTPAHRAAALQFGRPFRVTLPIPDGASSQLKRAHGVFSYWIETTSVMGIPRCGWSVSPVNRYWYALSVRGRVWDSGRNDVVIRAGACE